MASAMIGQVTSKVLLHTFSLLTLVFCSMDLHLTLIEQLYG